MEHFRTQTRVASVNDQETRGFSSVKSAKSAKGAFHAKRTSSGKAQNRKVGFEEHHKSLIEEVRDMG
jgi:hypothetical protein